MSPVGEGRARDEMGRFVPAVRAQADVMVTPSREVRDPRAATNQVQWMGRDLPMVPEWDAEAALRLGYLANVIAFRCIQVIAETCSSFPIRVGREKPARVGDRADFNPNAPLAKLLGPPPGGPNLNTSARNLLRWTFVQRLATGRNGWEIEEDGGRPVALWPLAASSLRAIPSRAGSRYWDRFEYGPAHEPVKLTRDQVLYGWTPSGTDWRQPEARLSAARYPLTIAVMGDRYQAAFLANGSVPAAIITTEEFADDKVRTAFRGQWQDRYSGPENAGRVAFNEVGDGEGSVSDAIHVEVLGLPQKDTQHLEQHKQALMEVAIGLGVPWSKLDASGRTFDNASEEDKTWLLSTIVPLLQDLEDEVNMQLAPRLGGDVCWFDLSGVEALRPAPRWNPAQSVVMVRERLITVNEGRREIGLPDVAGGDEFVPVKVQVEVPMPAALPAAVEDESARAKDPVPTQPVAAVGAAPLVGVRADGASLLPPAGSRSGSGLLPVETRTPSPAEIEARRASLWGAADSVWQSMERVWERAFVKLFERQASATLARLEAPSRTKRWAKAAEQRELRADLSQVPFDPTFWRAETVETALGLVEMVVAQGATATGRVLGVSFDLSDPWARVMIEARSNLLAGQVTDTTYTAVKDALSAGVAEGEGIPQLAERVRHVFDVATSSRATTIARTEVVSAYNASAVASASTLPPDVVGGQEWIATRDGRTREEHAEADGQVVPIGSPFDVGGEQVAYPGDGSAAMSVNCRCTVAFLTPDEMEGMGVGRSVPVGAARAAVRLVTAESFDPARFRRALLEAA